MNYNNYILFSKPGFIKGMGRILDIGGTINNYNTSENPDYQALKNDWKIIGMDMEIAIEDYKKKIEIVK